MSRKKGFKHTEEWKLLMSQKNSGSNNPNWRGGKLKCINCGKELATDWNRPKAKRCKDCYLKILQDGTKHWNYKGGISKTKEWRSVQDKLKRDKRRRNSVGTYTFEEWEKLKEKYNYRCPCCGKGEPDIKLTADHIIPLIKNGLNEISNIQPLCRSCNNKKYTKIIKYNLVKNL